MVMGQKKNVKKDSPVWKHMNDNINNSILFATVPFTLAESGKDREGRERIRNGEMKPRQ